MTIVGRIFSMVLAIVLFPLACGAPSSTPEFQPPPIEDDGAGGTDGAMIAITRLEGPSETLDAFCAAEGEACGAIDLGWKAEPLGPRGPLLEARLLAVTYTFESNAPAVRCKLALRTEAGWFATAEESPCGVDHEIDPTRIVVESFGWSGETDVVLAVDYTVDNSSSSAETVNPKTGTTFQLEGAQNTARYLRVCGVGPSGVPSCAGELVLEMFSELEGGCPTLDWEVSGNQLGLALRPGASYHGGDVDETTPQPCRSPDVYPLTIPLVFP